MSGEKKKRILEAAFFLLVMGLTFYTFFHGQDLKEIRASILEVRPAFLILAAFLSLFFISMEGVMIWYLLHFMNRTCRMTRCISYSCIGFFYSGITPSATGGQPVQLYYMQKDGNRLSDSTVVLMTVALIYKFVLVVLGAVLLAFWRRQLTERLGAYMFLYVLGLFLNLFLVALILTVMLRPSLIRRVANGGIRLLEKAGFLKHSDGHAEKLDRFIDNYREAVGWLLAHRNKVAAVTAMTFLQRCSLFLLTGVVYLGLGIHKTEFLTVLLLQASVYIAVDMLPLPGAQGITELMYQAVFLPVFSARYLLPSMVITRGLNFYFPLLASLLVVIWNACLKNIKK